MPATSKSQQRFMALVKLYLEGKIKNPSESVRRAAKSMSLEDANDFASTKHEGLPEKKTAQFMVVPSVLAYLAYKKKKKHEARKDKDCESIEKAAWKKTPVMIQNKEIIYEFESLEEACQYLASIGTLSYDEVEKLLEARENLINGFQVTYPSEKIADVIVIDPGRRQNAMLRAKRIRDMLLKADDHSEIIDEYMKQNRNKERAGEEFMNDVADVSDGAIKTIAGLFKDE